MTLFQRLFIACLSLVVAHVFAHSSHEHLTIEKTERSLWGVFSDNSGGEIVSEDPFSLPASTQYEVWVPLDAGLTSANNRFYLALDSLTQGKTDRIFRYAVKLVSHSGVENLRFEGLSCKYKAYRVYAFGNPDQTWLRATLPRWQDIVRNIHNDYAATLFDVFCRSTGEQTIEKIKTQLKSGRTYDFVP